MSVLATIEPTDLAVEPGAEASLLVRVRNRGSIVDRFDIAVVGPTSAWVTVDPPSLRLFPDKEGEARVTFRPPRAPDPAADTYPFGVSVRAASDVSASTVEEGHVAVGAFVQLATEIVPQTSRGSRSGSHDINVKNIGNSVAEVSVSASDPDRLLNFEVVPARAGLRPGGPASIRVQVKPKTTFFLGAAKRIPFSVQVDEPTAGSYQIPATIEQRAIIPSWVKPAAGLAVAALAAVLILPKMLGIGGAGASPSAAAVVETAPPATLAPPTIAATLAPEATEGPSPTPNFAPPDTLVAAGDKSPLEGGMVSLICPAGDPCRDAIKDRIIIMLANLQGKAAGARLASFSSTPAGTLPVSAEWKSWHYPYSSADGSKGDAQRISIDLAPSLVGSPSYVLIKDVAGNLGTFVIPSEDALLLRDALYSVTIVPPTPAPDPGGGGFVFSDIYLQSLNGIQLGDFVFVQP